jgi:hypothetical protein
MSRAGDVYINDASVASIEMGVSGTGKEQLAITFDHDDTQYPSVTKYLFFTNEAIGITEKDLATLGWDPLANGWRIDDMLTGGADGTPILLGARADLLCGYEEYNGKKTFKVKFINAPGERRGALKDRMSADQVRSFTAQLRSRLGATGGATRRPTVPASDINVGGADDDIPF